MGYSMGPGDGPSMDRVYITKKTGSTIRRYRHVVTPLVCLEMHAALMHCSGMVDVMLSERAETEQLEGDQARLPRFELGEFTVADRDLNEVPPYQNDAFMSQHIREAHRGRHTVDCGNSGMSPELDILQSLAGDTSPLETDGSDSDQPADAPSEPAPPPHPAAMGNASPVRGLGGAEDSAIAEGVEPTGQSAGLDEGVAPGSGGAEVASADGFAKPEHVDGCLDRVLHSLTRSHHRLRRLFCTRCRTDNRS